ncbi:MAG: DUF4403 family protein [Cyclobacteriaceae bacterium]
MSFRSIVLIFFLIGLLMSSCKRVKPKVPVRTTLDSVLVIPLSTLTLPIRLSVADLEVLINSKIEGVFVKNWIKLNDEGDSLYIEIERKAKVKIAWDGRRLSSRFPIKVSGNFVKRIAGITIRNSEPVSTEVVLHLSTELELTPQWHLKPKSSLDRIDWVSDPSLKVGGLKIDLRKVVEQAIDNHKEELVGKLDQALSDQLNTRKSIQKIWTDIQKPILLSKRDPKFWLLIHGENLTASVDHSIVDDIQLNVELQGFLQTSMTVEKNRKNIPLPKNMGKVSPNDSLKVTVLGRIPFAEVNKILNARLVGKSISSQGYKATIKELELYGVDNSLALACRVSGDVRGTVYARGGLGYDSANQVLFVSDFDYDVESRSALVNSADWLLHGDALDVVEQELRIEVDEYIKAIPMLIEQGVKKGRVGEKIDLVVNSMEVTPLTFVVTTKDIQILLEVEGKAEISLNKNTFVKKK